MKINTVTKVTIYGHSDCNDEKHQAEKHQRISKIRADTIKEHLIEKGISKNRILTFGKGGTEPKISCDNDPMRHNPENQRIETSFDKPTLIKEILERKTDKNKLIVSIPLNLRKNKNDTKSNPIGVVPIAKECQIITKSNELFYIRISGRKVLDYWYKISYSENGQNKKGWVYGFYTNKQLESIIIDEEYIAKDDSIETLLKYAKSECKECLPITQEWLKITNPNSMKDNKVTKGEDFFIKGFREKE